MNKLNDTYVLANKVEVPCIGFGTWQSPDDETTVNAVKTAIECGYRHIDTAAAYNNEASVGMGIKAGGIKREELFITTKVWNENRGYEKTRAAFEESLSKLDLEYLDLYLIHWPATKGEVKEWTSLNAETWRAMEDLYEEGKIKAIGVCNFLTHHLTPLMANARINPMINQIEFHPGMMQNETVEFCKQHGIIVEAWSPLGTGKMLDNPVLKDIAKGYGKSVAQVCIRWCLENGTLPLPKSVTASRIKENKEVFDFKLSNQDRKTINEMVYFGGSDLHPDKVPF